MRILQTLLGVCLWLLASAATATTYHVASTGGASDANPGTAAQPWATLQHAVDFPALAAGDTILVHAGTYVGARITRSGAPGLPITVAAAPGEVVVIRGESPDAAHTSAIEVEDFGDIVRWWVIEGFEIDGEGVRRYGIDLRFTENVTVRDNLIYDAFRTGIFTAFSDDVVIEGNASHNNCEHGIYHSNSGDRPIIRGNSSWTNGGAGIHMNADVSQGGDGIIDDALVEANWIVDNGAGLAGCSCGTCAGGAGINMDGVRGSLIRNNVIIDEHATGIAAFRIDGAICSQNNRILHNTIIPSASGRWAVLVNNIAVPASGCPNNTILNNILYSEHSFRGAIAVDAASLASLTSNGNVSEGWFSTDAGSTRINFAAWQALGKDATSTEIASGAALDALFVDRAGDDLHLAAMSAAIDAGVVVPDVPWDFDGKPRPRGLGFDAGAFETGEVIFLDGFESGSTSAWSATVP